MYIYLEKKSTYALVAEYIVNNGVGNLPELEALLTMTPPPLLTIPGKTIAVILVTEITLQWIKLLTELVKSGISAKNSG